MQNNPKKDRPFSHSRHKKVIEVLRNIPHSPRLPSGDTVGQHEAEVIVQLQMSARGGR